MGTYKYMTELYRKKQSDVLQYLQRIRMWHYRQLSSVHRAPRPTRLDKARKLGYKAKQGYCIYRVRVRRGGRKRPVPEGQTVSKPTNQGVNRLNFQRGLRNVAEERARRRCSALRVLNSYWVGQDSTYKYFEIIMVDPHHKAITRDPAVNWLCEKPKSNKNVSGSVHASWKSRKRTHHKR